MFVDGLGTITFLVPWREAGNLMIWDGFLVGPGAERPWPVRGNLVRPWALLH